MGPADHARARQHDIVGMDQGGGAPVAKQGLDITGPATANPPRIVITTDPTRNRGAVRSDNANGIAAFELTRNSDGANRQQ